MGAVLSQLTAQRMLAQVRHVTPVPPGRAAGLVARVYRQVKRDFGVLAPPIGLHSPAPVPLAASWLMLRESLVASGLATRAVKEAVAAAVSAANACPYCVEVHTTALGGLAGPQQARAIAAPAQAATGDLTRVAAWATATGTREGAARHGVPFPVTHAPELIGVVVTFQYLNRMVSLFLPESPLPPTVPDGIRPFLHRAAGLLVAMSTRRPRTPGAALALLPEAPLPADLAWSAPNAVVAAAFARAATAVEAAAARLVPEGVRAAVHTRLSTWNGEPPGLDLYWLRDALAELAPTDRTAGRLALLTAFAPSRVDVSTVEDYRHGDGDQGLITLASWASLAAARRIGQWVGEACAQP